MREGKTRGEREEEQTAGEEKEEGTVVKYMRQVIARKFWSRYRSLNFSPPGTNFLVSNFGGNLGFDLIGTNFLVPNI